MKNKKYYLIALAVIIVLGIGFLVNGQFLQGSIRKGSSNTSVPIVDVKVNGSKGPVTISSLSEVVEVSWTSTNATACSFSNELSTGLVPPSGVLEVKGGEFIGEEFEANGWIWLSCQNGGGWSTDTVQVIVEEN